MAKCPEDVATHDVSHGKDVPELLCMTHGIGRVGYNSKNSLMHKGFVSEDTALEGCDFSEYPRNVPEILQDPTGEIGKHDNVPFYPM